MRAMEGKGEKGWKGRCTPKGSLGAFMWYKAEEGSWTVPWDLRASSGPSQGPVRKERRKGHLAALCIGIPLVTSTERSLLRVHGQTDSK